MSRGNAAIRDVLPTARHGTVRSLAGLALATLLSIDVAGAAGLPASDNANAALVGAEVTEKSSPKMALSLPLQASWRIVFTDRVDGFFEGHTAQAGLGRYQIGDDVLLAGIEVAVAGAIQSRAAVKQAPVLSPNRLRSQFDQVTEQIALQQGRRQLFGSWQLNAPATLSARFHLPAAAQPVVTDHLLTAASTVTRSPSSKAVHSEDRVNKHAITLSQTADGLYLLQLRYASTEWFLAVRASEPVTVQLIPLLEAAGPFLLQVESTRQTTQLAVSLSYGHTAKKTIADALAIAPERAFESAIAPISVSEFSSSDASYNRALAWAKFSATSFVVEQFGKGIWAGLPWFRDNWGRDTFIALPGTLLVTGQFAEARAVLDNFIHLQRLDTLDDPEYGRIPNRVAAGQTIIYNTVDGTPWLIRELLEYLRYTGDIEYGLAQLPLIEAYVRGVERHWLDGNGLLTHDDADTWMDARIAGMAAWSPRGNRAVEIQALWFTALEVAVELTALQGRAADAERYRARAEQVRHAFLQAFWNGQQMADRLHADGQPDYRLRPNQLMLISIPFEGFVPETVEADVLRQTVSGLLFPYGIASLDPRDPAFHPRHENPAFHHKDAAYHNGTIWGWNAGFTVTAMAKYGYQDLAWQLTRNLSDQILYGETPGTMSELLDALPAENGAPKASGTYAQAWSVAEFVRNAYQDYLGFRPDLLKNRLYFRPALPNDWQSLQARLPFGKSEILQLELTRDGTHWLWQFSTTTALGRELMLDLLASDGSRHRVRFALQKAKHELSWDGAQAELDGAPLATAISMPSQRKRIGNLKFLPPPPYRPSAFPVLRGKDVLEQQILASPAAANAKPVRH